MNDHLPFDRLSDYVHGELTPADDALVHAHLAACAGCRAEYDAEIALSEALRGAAAAEELELPAFVRAAVWQQIRDARPGPFARLAAALKPAIAIPVAAALVVGGGLVSAPLLRGGAAPTIPVSSYFAIHAAQAGQTPLADRPGPQALETSMLDAPAPAVADPYVAYASEADLAVR